MSKSSLITKGLEKCLSGPHVLHCGRPVFCLQKQLRENMCQFFFKVSKFMEEIYGVVFKNHR